MDNYISQDCGWDADIKVLIPKDKNSKEEDQKIYVEVLKGEDVDLDSMLHRAERFDDYYDEQTGNVEKILHIAAKLKCPPWGCRIALKLRKAVDTIIDNNTDYSGLNETYGSNLYYYIIKDLMFLSHNIDDKNIEKEMENLLTHMGLINHKLELTKKANRLLIAYYMHNDIDELDL